MLDTLPDDEAFIDSIDLTRLDCLLPAKLHFVKMHARCCRSSFVCFVCVADAIESAVLLRPRLSKRVVSLRLKRYIGCATRPGRGGGDGGGGGYNSP